ncbi:MAG: ketol-acid reductoisomerase [Candidatus Bipolaricaulota bacterium]|nr:ketol-acid reductoisomerase [Candidatus Bipolaricaulota bacterium]MBS3791380.1 ketol-acid reductoisomerase [Candidatus Bipolaricaulota bacterium]
MSATVYYSEDAEKSYISDKKVAIIGYGSQGRGQAQNLNDSGVDVIVGLREGSYSRDKAKDDGLKVGTIEEAAKAGEVVQMLIPDNVQPEVYRNKVEPYLSSGDALFFSHGFNIHFNQIQPPDYVDVVMVAPKGPGNLVRRVYKEGEGVPALLAIYQDYTGESRDVGLAYAHGLGATRAGVILTTFKEETETDLFGEQAVLCGGVTELIKAGYETLTEEGYQPEIAYFEVLNELKLIVDLIYEGGLTEMRRSISDTAEYGDLTRGKRVIGEESRKAMKELLKEVKSGEFAREWITENKANRPQFTRLQEMDENHEIEDVGRKLREMITR